MLAGELARQRYIIYTPFKSFLNSTLLSYRLAGFKIWLRTPTVMPTLLFLDFLAENMAIKSTYSVYKFPKFPSRESKSIWHLSRGHFIGIYSCAGKILVTKEELITEALNNCHDILKHRRNLLVEMWWVDCSVLGFFHNGTLACHYTCDLRQGARDNNRRTTVLREKMRSEKIQWHGKNSLCFVPTMLCYSAPSLLIMLLNQLYWGTIYPT